MAVIIASEKLLGKLRARGRAAPGALMRGLMKSGRLLQRESQLVVPVEFNVLRPSANTRPDGKDAVVVSYGTDYAVYVHEDMEARHKPGKQAKFLEEPYNRLRPTFKKIIKEELERK